MIKKRCRYTKALEAIKKLKSEQTQAVREYKLQLENLKTLKDAALKVTAIVSLDDFAPHICAELSVCLLMSRL